MEGIPRVSVVVVVYNGENHIERAIKSIQQQDFTDWELVVIEDGSTDQTAQIVEQLAEHDARIRMFRNQGNQGLIYTRNKGFQEARGEYIAILDSDDESYSSRLSKQVEFLDQHPDYGICGATYIKKYIDGSEGLWDFPESDTEIRALMFWGVGNLNSSVVIRKSILEKHSIRYDEEYPVSEDYKLFFDISRHAKLHNLKEVLGVYYYHDGQQTTVRKELLKRCSSQIMHRYFELAGIPLDDEAKEVLFKVYNYKFPLDRKELVLAENLLVRFVEHNEQQLLIHPETINFQIGKRFFECCYHSAGKKASSTRSIWNQSALRKHYSLKNSSKVKFWIRQHISN